MSTKPLTAEQKAKKNAAERARRAAKKAAEGKSVKVVAKAKPAPKKAAPAKTVKAGKEAETKAIAKDVAVVLNKPLRIFFNQNFDESQSQMLKAGQEINLEDTGKTHVNEAGKTVKVFRFRRGVKRVYYTLGTK